MRLLRRHRDHCGLGRGVRPPRERLLDRSVDDDGDASERVGVPHVASGDLFRDNIKRGTALGTKVKKYLDSGALVPDDVTVAKVSLALGARGSAKLESLPLISVDELLATFE